MELTSYGAGLPVPRKPRPGPINGGKRLLTSPSKLLGAFGVAMPISGNWS